MVASSRELEHTRIVPETPLEVQKMRLVLRQQVGETGRVGDMRHEAHLVFWIGAAFVVSLGIACTVFAVKGISTKGFGLAMGLTARWSFLLFWMAYTSRALVKLFGPSLAPLAKHGREFGLAFAAAFLVHLGMAAGFSLLTWRPALTGWALPFFLTGAFWIYLLAVFSFGGLAKALGSRGWRAMRMVGMNYILCAFSFDFVPAATHSPIHYGLSHFVAYAPFAAMCVSAPFLVFAAAIYGRLEDRYSHMKLQSAVN
jgi:hypothetical protein